MANCADRVADLLRQEGSGLSPEKFDETPGASDAQGRRTTLLAETLQACEELRSSGSEELDDVAEKLADGSRDGM